MANLLETEGELERYWLRLSDAEKLSAYRELLRKYKRVSALGKDLWVDKREAIDEEADDGQTD